MIFPNGHALLIGVGKYLYNAYTPYLETAADASQLADVLRDPDRCGYPASQVRLVTDADATRQNILDALDALASNTAEGDTVLIFYSGHGDYGPGERYFLTTYDTQKANGAIDPATAVSEQELLRKLRALPAKRAFLIFNACFAGNIAPALGGEEGQILPARTAVALLGTGEGRVIITACREQQKSYLDAPPKPLTFFGQALVDALRGEGVPPRKGYIGIYDLYEAVFEQVKTTVETRWARVQEPELTVNKAVGPLPVALYQGQKPAGALGPDDLPSSLSGLVRQVEPAEAEHVLKHVLSGNFNVVVADSVTGDTIDARGSQGFLNHPRGPVNQTFGDLITVRDISNSTGVAIGRGAQSTVGTSSASLFEPDTSKLIDILNSKLKQGDLDILAVVMEDYGTFTFDPSSFPSELPKQVSRLITLCRQNKAMMALIRGLIARRIIDAQQQAWQEWAEKQDQRTA